MHHPGRESGWRPQRQQLALPTQVEMAEAHAIARMETQGGCRQARQGSGHRAHIQHAAAQHHPSLGGEAPGQAQTGADSPRRSGPTGIRPVNHPRHKALAGDCLSHASGIGRYAGPLRQGKVMAIEQINTAFCLQSRHETAQSA